MKGRALVIGATGLLGYGVTNQLSESGWTVRAIGKESLIDSHIFSDKVEYLSGDFYDETFLVNSLKNIDTVFFFLSSTFPSTSSDSLELEISRSLKGLDYLLRKMKDAGIKKIVFPSSGGTVYGDLTDGFAKETDELKPITPYGVGKKMSEDILRFYAQFGINALVLRVGNVYGSPMTRKTKQGVIDTFVQKALLGEPVSVWGDALYSERDYIYADDFSKAVCLAAEKDIHGMEVYNLGSGVGTTLETILDIISNSVNLKIDVKKEQENSASAIRRIVLDMNKFNSTFDYKPEYDIRAGIIKTIERKKHIDELL